MSPINEKISELRKKVDNADEKIIHYLIERFKLTDNIHKIKRSNEIQILDENRWEVVIDKIKKICNENGFDFSIIKKLYDIIHEEANKR
jgi:chorismate mutase